MSTLSLQIPEKLQCLYEAKRYKVLYGGRAGTKSWGAATAALVQGLQKPKKVLCAREFQTSIRDSVHALLSQQIKMMNLQGFYTVKESSIVGQNGTEFIFAGLRHNIDNIKSAEGIDICWVEEAVNVSKTSWEKLGPTIRKPGSEIWVTFNPELDTDETYKRFVLNPPTNSVVQKINWQDNPWFSEELRQEKEDCYARDMDDYLHIWEGHCKQTVEGAVYAKELQAAMAQNRITKVPVIPGKPIDTFWDLGKHDHTSIWFAQITQGEYRLVDFFQERGEDPEFYLKVLQGRGYLYGTHYLPHDAAHNRMGALSIERQFDAAYPGKVTVLDRIDNVPHGIAMMRTVFPLCWFDEEKCADGLQALRRYKYKVEEGAYGKYPLHDENSDACLVGESLVLTANGYKEIKGIVVGELVWTPSGFSKVVDAGAVKYAEDLLTIQLTNGNILECTSDHKILSNRGFVQAQSLMVGDKIYSGDEWQCTLLSLLSTVLNIGFRAVITKARIGEGAIRAPYIEQFGNFIMAQYQMGMKFIIKTTIKLTIPSKIWRLCSLESISANIRSNESGEENYFRHQNMRWSVRQSGTAAQKALNGISGTARKAGRVENGPYAFARFVGKNIGLLSLRGPNTATTIAKLSHTRCPKGKTLVYDLTVENHGCYQANGLLVSNCDAIRQLAQSLEFRKPKPVMKTIQVSKFNGYRAGGNWMGT